MSLKSVSMKVSTIEQYSAEWSWKIEKFSTVLNLLPTTDPKIVSGSFEVGAGSFKPTSWKMMIDTTNERLSKYVWQTLLRVGLSTCDSPSRNAVVDYQLSLRTGSDDTPICEDLVRHFLRLTDTPYWMTVKEKYKLLEMVKDGGQDNLIITVKMTVYSDVVQTTIPAFHYTPVSSTNYYNPELLTRQPDIKLVCQGKTFFVHKSILTAQSQVFQRMLETPMSESEKGEIEFNDMDLSVVELMIDMMYGGNEKLSNISDDKTELLKLLDCAEIYDLKPLKSACLAKLCSRIIEKDVGELALTLYKYNADKEFVDYVQDYCLKHHGTLMKNPDYMKMYCQTPQAFGAAFSD